MRLFLSLFLILVALKSYGQDYSGKILYQFSFKEKAEKSKDPLINDVRNILSSSFQVKFRLLFSKNESTFKENDRLNSPSIVPSIVSGFAGETTYKNVVTRRYIDSKEFFGKRFLIKDSLPKYKWTILKDKKAILGYECYKAILKDEESIVEAWFSPTIPISNGPEYYWGLPGLILSVSNKSYNLSAISIELNSNKEVKIKIPTKGDVVTKSKYDSIVEIKTRQIKNQFINGKH